ncbi:MAG TPA: DUF72 domain-containing protein [Steroidobacteraceae bacterium]|nr:DUF72 domain-containing protein [Steroidobacteraceae bacterium]
MATIRIGISGWRYAPWRGPFYPPDLPQRAELSYASRRFPTIEINGSFYSLQRPGSYAQWYAQTPDGFVFSLKGGRYITHMLRLREVEQALANFFASGVFNLREKLGPILWQFPPNFGYERERMQRFFRLLPRDTTAACSLARRRSAWMQGRVRLATDGERPLRHAVEVRHESFRDASFVELLREHGIALVIAETAGQWPMAQDVTADFMYIRLHGDKELYRSGYSPRALARWAQRIRAWHEGSEPADAQTMAGGHPRSQGARDVYCYFDNTDVKLRAPRDARSLMRRLAIDWCGDDEGSGRRPSAPRRPPGAMAAPSGCRPEGAVESTGHSPPRHSKMQAGSSR